MRRLLARLTAAIRFAVAAPHVLDPARNTASFTLVEHAGAPGTVLRSAPIDIDETLRSDGTVPIKIISPGWGTTGYYSAELLEKHAAVFTAGTHMYLDHPTMTEAVERPERSVRDLAAVLETAGRWVADHPKGPGVYAEAKVLGPYRPVIDELGPHIGVSIRAAGTGHQGTAEGRNGTIVDTLERAHSVDFVTKAGRGGQVLSLLESAGLEVDLQEAADVASWMESRIHLDFTTRADDMFGDGRLTREERIALSSGIGEALDAFRAAVEAKAPQLYQRGRWDDPAAIPTPTTVTTEEAMTPDQIKELRESIAADVLKDFDAKLEEATKPLADELEAEKAKNASLTEALAIGQARTLAESLADSDDLAKGSCKGLPAVTRMRVIEAATRSPKLTDDGKVDEAALAESMVAEVKVQTEYLEAAGVRLGGGDVRLGDGGTSTLTESDTKPGDEKALEESLRGVFGLAKTA